jgi:hypothetical protein
MTDSSALGTGERQFFGLEIIQEAEEQVCLIWENLRTPQSRQKSYADTRRSQLEFKEGDHMYLKVSLIRGMRRFKVKGKLSPRFIHDPKASRGGCLHTRITRPSCRCARCLPCILVEEVSHGTRGATTYAGT